MAKIKTSKTKVRVEDFIESYVTAEQKKADSYELIRLLQKWSGSKPYMYGPTIVGFGNYHYVYDSGHSGDAPMLGFSPRKAEFSLYVFSPTPENEKLVKQLGKFSMGKSCIYIKKLADINLEVLEKLCRNSLKYLKAKYECSTEMA